MRPPLLLAVLLLAGCARGEEPAAAMPAEPERITVFAAASLTDVVEALARAYEADGGARVVVSAGASSDLARQIVAGAPADVFLSASPEWTAFLAAERALAAPPQPLARNRLVVLGPPGAEAIAGPADLLRFARIAVADPAHVPAGVYAREALETAGLWAQVQPRLLPTLDARAAVATLQRGAADAALAYASDTLAAPDLAVLLEWPDASHPDVRLEGAAVTARGRAFLAFATALAQRPVWRRFGFRPVAPP
jgi:molybdate transport system substrate-binding protein